MNVSSLGFLTYYYVFFTYHDPFRAFLGLFFVKGAPIQRFSLPPLFISSLLLWGVGVLLLDEAMEGVREAG